MDKLEELQGYLRQLIAVEVLEYEDQNWLGRDAKLRSENKEELLNICRLIVAELKEERDLFVAPLREEVIHQGPCNSKVCVRVPESFPGFKPCCRGKENHCGKKNCSCHNEETQ